MSVIILGSGIAVAINLMIAGTSFYFSRVPGWRYYRTFGIICLMLALYAFNDIWFVATDTVGNLREIISTINLVLAVSVAGLLLVFNRQQSNEALSRNDKVLLSTLACFAVVDLIPGIGVDGHSLVEVSSVNIVYQIPNMTYVGQLSMALGLLCVLVVVFRYWSAAMRGEKGAWLNTIGVFLFVLFALEEALVASQVLNWPFLLDWGFASMVLLVAVDLSTKVSRNSLEINELNKDLERRVLKHSEELASTQERLFVAERQVALEQLAAGIGHEVNNPLASIGGNLEFLRDRVRDSAGMEEEIEALDEALDGVQRIHQIVCDLTLSALDENSDTEVCNPADAIAVAIRLVDPEYRILVGFSVALDCESLVRVGESKLTQVLLNLLTNAVHAVEAGERANTPVEIHCRPLGDRLQIDVKDSGAGVDSELVHRIFDPLFTTKEVGKGTGLGLYVSRSIIESTGGELVLSKSDSEGTTMSIVLRLADPDEAKVLSRGAVVDGVLRASSEVRIYLIDDEVMMTKAIQRMARGHLFEIENDSQAALKHLLDGNQYDLILCDLMMPTMTGMELYRRCVEEKPELRDRFVFVTGGAVTSEAQAFVDSPGIRVFAKPMPKATLLKVIAEAGSRK